MRKGSPALCSKRLYKNAVLLGLATLRAETASCRPFERNSQAAEHKKSVLSQSD
jgi:hypothetical protein